MSETQEELALAEKLSFEQALEKLEEIVAELEAGQLPLEKAMEKFEQATRLKTRCEKLLTQAEARIEELTEPAGEEAAEK